MSDTLLLYEGVVPNVLLVELGVLKVNALPIVGEEADSPKVKG